MKEFEPSVSPRFIAYVRDYLLDRQVDPENLFLQCGLRADDDGELAVPVHVDRICQLFSLVAQSQSKPYFGLELSAGYHFESSSLLIVAFMAAPTVREAFGTLLRYDKYVDSAIDTRLASIGGLTCFEVDLITAENVDTEHLSEYLLAFVCVALEKATRRKLPTSRVAFTHTTHKNMTPVAEFFGSPVVYGTRQNALHFDEAFLETPLHTANSLLYEVTCNALRSNYTAEGEHYDFMEVVRRQLLLQFKTGNPTVASVAQALQISPRTLRRRLAEHDTKLQDVKNDARAQRARFYLQHTSLPLTEIAHEIGFSELSAFVRAFKAWTGDTPQVYRQA